MSAYADIGPTLPPRVEVYCRAAELERLARLARELATAGPGGDLARAVRMLDRARELLSMSGAGAGDI